MRIVKRDSNDLPVFWTGVGKEFTLSPKCAACGLEKVYTLAELHVLAARLGAVLVEV